MPQRKDGKTTREKLLNAACEVFAQKGYRDANVAEICRRADANIAAVNYHFKDKANLYAATWLHAFQKFEDPSFSKPVNGSPQKRVREYIQTLMQNFATKGRVGYFSRLYLMEILNPSGLVQDAWHEFIEPQRRKLHYILREIIGQKADVQSILFCELSIVNQCRALLTIKHNDLEYLLDQPINPKLIKRLADHIADFSLAGIKAVGKGKT